MKNDQRENLNPTPEARFAMYMWPDEYAAQGGGSMDFYWSLDERRQRLCDQAIAEIREAIKNHPPTS